MSNAIKRLMLGGLMALAVAFPINSMAGDTLQRVVDFKVLKVGMSANQPPMTMVNREGGVMGFDVDLARALASGYEGQAGNQGDALRRTDDRTGRGQNRHGDVWHVDHPTAD